MYSLDAAGCLLSGRLTFMVAVVYMPFQLNTINVYSGNDWMCIFLKGDRSRSNTIAGSLLIELEKQTYKISTAIIEEHNCN